jgi:hypothetical protein
LAFILNAFENKKKMVEDFQVGREESPPSIPAALVVEKAGVSKKEWD